MPSSFAFCQRRTNPREGIETYSGMLSIVLASDSVREERILVRGLKHGVGRLIVSRRHSVREERILVRGLKLYALMQALQDDLDSQRRTNPREGIETPLKLCMVNDVGFRQRRTNPREGIETQTAAVHLHLRDIVREERILVRGLKRRMNPQPGSPATSRSEKNESS